MMRSILMVTLFAIGAAVAQQFPEMSLYKILSEEEQQTIGVAKLNNEERENLRILIIKKYLAGFEEGKKEGIKQAAEYFAIQKDGGSSEVIESQIDGDFEGWEGETIVKMMNGQIWQQTEYYYHYHYAFMPDVLIYKSGSGYKMKVDGVEKAVGVIR